MRRICAIKKEGVRHAQDPKSYWGDDYGGSSYWRDLKAKCAAERPVELAGLLKEMADFIAEHRPAMGADWVPDGHGAACAGLRISEGSQLTSTTATAKKVTLARIAARAARGRKTCAGRKTGTASSLRYHRAQPDSKSRTLRRQTRSVPSDGWFSSGRLREYRTALFSKATMTLD
jgi:hypothetical protein